MTAASEGGSHAFKYLIPGDPIWAISATTTTVGRSRGPFQTRKSNYRTADLKVVTHKAKAKTIRYGARSEPLMLIATAQLRFIELQALLQQMIAVHLTLGEIPRTWWLNYQLDNGIRHVSANWIRCICHPAAMVHWNHQQ